MRKKSISLIVVLTFLMTLFPLALPAFAATTEYDALSIPKFADDVEDVELGKIRITFDVLTAGLHEAWISLPSGFDITGVAAGGTHGGLATFGTPKDESVIMKVYSATDDTDVDIILTLKSDIPSGSGGEDIVAEFENISGQFIDGKVTIGRVVGDGDLTVKVVEDENFSDDGGEVTIRVTESLAGTLNNDDTLDLILPDGFEWGDISGEDVLFGDGYGGTGSDFVIATPDEEELSVKFVDETNARTAFEFTAEIKVDFDEAEFGDVVAKVRGDYDASPDTITVGTYGDYEATVTADDPETIIYSGRLEQEVSNIIIEEQLAGSLVEGRMINFELPDNARWTMVDGKVIDESTSFSITGDDVTLQYAGIAGKNDTVLRFKVTDSSDDEDASEIEIEDIEVATEAGVVGDLVVKVTSSAGLADDEIVIAKIVSPVTVTAAKENVIIGKNDQPGGNITITEYDAEALEEGNLVISVDKDIEFSDDPTVEVTAGDIRIGDVDADDNTLTIEIERDSNEASTIEISGILYDVNRTVAEGDLDAKVGGSAAEETSTFDYLDEDDIWEDSDAVAEFVAAICVTPAPGQQQIKAVFTLGSTTYTLNDVEQTMDVAPYAKNGRTYLPMRYVAKALGIADTGILWKNGTATFISADRVVSVTIGSTIMTINGAPVPIDAAPEIVNGRTMLPIRWLATAFGVDVAWDAETQTVTVQ